MNNVVNVSELCSKVYIAEVGTCLGIILEWQILSANISLSTSQDEPFCVVKHSKYGRFRLCNCTKR